MIRSLALALGLLVALLVAVGFLGARPPDGSKRPVWFRVEPGESLSFVAARLRSEGLVRDRRLFLLLGVLTNSSSRIQAGRYRPSGTMWSHEILRMLRNGDTVPIRIVFPEGIWLGEIADLVADSLGIPADTFLAYARREGSGTGGSDIEGFLFPATYEFQGTEPLARVIGRMREESDARWSPAHEARARELDMSRHEIVTLASIIEAEARRSAERPVISAVYHRRLARGMRLEADPTIVYALGERGRSPLYADLEVNSPYNTYRRTGLPPGPIGNPGDASILAALYPDTATTALFFVARPDGSHIFSDTFEEHVAARRGRRR